jgi:hypothetical protein
MPVVNDDLARGHKWINFMPNIFTSYCIVMCRMYLHIQYVEIEDRTGKYVNVQSHLRGKTQSKTYSAD